MGKRRDSDMDKIDAFEREMNEYANQHGRSPGPREFVFRKRLKRQLLELSRKPGASIDTILESLRESMKNMVDNPILFTSWDDMTLH